MKTNQGSISLSIGTILCLSTVFSWINSAQAQTINSPLNGLFTPTQAQQFFEAGRSEFETEKIYRPQKILEFEEALIDSNYTIEQMNDIIEQMNIVPQSETDREKLPEE